MRRLLGGSMLSIFGLLLAACSSEEPTTQVEAEPVERPPVERRIGYLTGAATLVTLKIYEPDAKLNTQFELTVNTVDRDDCAGIFDNSEPWVSYCAHAQKEKMPFSITSTIPQVPAGGEEAYAGELKTPDAEAKIYKMFLLPSLMGTLAVRSATTANKEVQFDDPTFRFDDSEKKVTASKNAIDARRR